MRLPYLLLVMLVLLLTACGPDRAQTIDPPPAATGASTVVSPAEVPTEEQVATPEPTAAPAEPTATELQPTATVVEPTETPVEPTPEPTATEVPPTPTSPPSADALEEQLIASLLTIEDMPTGWTGTAPEFEERTPGGTYSAFCSDDLPARSIARASVALERSALGPLFRETIVVYPDRAAAVDAFNDLVKAANNCSEVVDDNGNRTALSPLSFPSLGDDTFALRGSGLLELDEIKIRIDNVIINITHGGLGGVDSAVTEELARLAVDKYR